MEEYNITDSTARLGHQPLRGLVNITDTHKQNSIMCGFAQQHNQKVPGLQIFARHPPMHMGGCTPHTEASVGPAVLTMAEGHHI